MGEGEEGVLWDFEGRVDVLAVCEPRELCVFDECGEQEFSGEFGWVGLGGVYEFVCGEVGVGRGLEEDGEGRGSMRRIGERCTR